MTLGIWEVIGTPVEAMNDGYKASAQVTYDANNDVDQIELYKEGKVAELFEGDLLTAEEKEAYSKNKEKILKDKRRSRR